MLKNLFDFNRKRNLKEAVVFYLFYIGCFIIVNAVITGRI